MSRLRKEQPAASSALFGCLTIQQFPVWAAQYENPLLAVQPLIIHRQGRVYAACVRVLEAGVRIGWDLQRAQSLCPTAKARSFNANIEAYAWEEILKQFYGLTPKIEPVRNGCLYFEPPSQRSKAWVSTMGALAKLVREWNAQAALASDRVTAELAALAAREGELRRIRDERGFLRNTPLAALGKLGLSADAIERLDWFGFITVYELQQLTRNQIESQFADKSKPLDARLLWRFARAGTVDADRQPIQSYQLPSVRSARFVFEQAATSPVQWEGALSDIVQQAAAQLNGMSAGAVTVTITTNAGEKSTQKLLREAVSSPRNLLRVSNELTLSLIGKTKVEVVALEVQLSRLSGEGQSSTLFDTRRYDTTASRFSPPRLVSALRNIESRYKGAMGRYRLRDEYAALREERYSYGPVLNEVQ
jgi:hypothetical protein